ncbi:tyrosine-type recombinase/integrase [Thioalbus denitrificans]|uniref:Site-specific recombinase XerD n=1 Tax=Thioalbus denitrificans TaxID=547122 RepID=A0A369C3G4_9GAMM|nr:site-specific integrase [Thioalbus denitrificans]RCX28439.1 site-specific recombinase XerD [Thioalbus denitrificans]
MPKHGTKFTDADIRNAKLKATRYDLREGDGFGVRVSPTGERSFFFAYDFLGRRRRMTLGRYPDLSLKDARREKAKAAALLAQGIDPATKRANARREQSAAEKAEREAETVAHLASEYLEKWAKPRKRSAAEDERMLQKDVLPKWKRRKVKDITRRDVNKLLDGIAARGAPIAANRTLALVRRMFNFAVEKGYLDSSPATHVRPPAKENRRERILSDEEIRAFWNRLDGVTPYTRHALRLLLLTGQRSGEVLQMEWSELDMAGGWWTIPAAKAKNGETHRVPLAGMALDIIRELDAIRASEQWVFPGRNQPKDKPAKPMTRASLSRAVTRWATGNPWTPHDLRRTVATRLGELGFDRLVQDKVLNHKDRTVGGIYDRHTYDTEKRQAMDAWDRRLRSILGLAEAGGNVVTLRQR